MNNNETKTADTSQTGNNMVTTPKTDHLPKDLTDLYDVLGLESTATVEEIQQAYRKAAMKYHPDRTEGDPELTKLFHACKVAFDVLIDPDKRAHYDDTGEFKVSGDDLHVEASQMVHMSVLAAIDEISASEDPRMHVWAINPLICVRDKLREDIKALRVEIKKHNATLKRFKAMHKRMNSKKNPNFDQTPIGNMIQEKLRWFRSKSYKMDHFVSVRELAVQLIDDYDYDQKPDPEYVAAMAQAQAQAQTLKTMAMSPGAYPWSNTPKGFNLGDIHLGMFDTKSS